MFPEEMVLIGATDVFPEGVIELLVLRRGCTYRAHLEALLIRRGVTNYRILELGTIEAILGLAAAGIGISLLPKSVVMAAASQPRFSAELVPASHRVVQTVYVRRRDGFNSSAAKALVACMKEVHASQLDGRFPSAEVPTRRTDDVAKVHPPIRVASASAGERVLRRLSPTNR